MQMQMHYQAQPAPTRRTDMENWKFDAVAAVVAAAASASAAFVDVAVSSF